MRAFIERLGQRLWPDLAGEKEADQQARLAELTAVAVTAPLLVVALVVLIAVTDVAVIRTQWSLFLLLLGITTVLSFLSFFQRFGEEAGRYSYSSSDLEVIVTTAALFILGPAAIWIHLLNRIVFFATTWRESRFSQRQRWNWLRNLLFNLLAGIITGLLVLGVYRRLGGRLPLPALAPVDTLAAFVALSLDLLVGAVLLWLLLFPFTYFLGRERMGAMVPQTIFFFFVATLPAFFGVLGAAIYSQMGLFAFLFFVVGVLLVSLLARQLSLAGIKSQQRATELAQLEELGRAIIEASPELGHLSRLLARFLPQMFDYSRAEIRLFDEGVLVQLPPGDKPLPASLWRWFRENPRLAALERSADVPGRSQLVEARVLLAPILSGDDQAPIGGIALTLVTEQAGLGLDGTLLSLRVLAAQIASTLQRMETQAQILAYERVQQELAFARQIQVSFLPGELPALPGWELTAKLRPARQTSGDFYDVIALPGGKVGLVMADVADKGMGAALFMALSRTLVRTNAVIYPDRPAQVLAAANRRILADTSNDMFVTVFYGVLDPESGTLHYANAGHNAPFVGREPLPITGMPLGIMPEAAWKSRRVQVAPGETVVLYTDGVSEAHDADNQQFGTDRLLAAVVAHEHEGVEAIVAGVWQALADFVGDTDQFDDMALLLLRRAGSHGGE